MALREMKDRGSVLLREAAPVASIGLPAGAVVRAYPRECGLINMSVEPCR